jgi:hypothetical protein
VNKLKIKGKEKANLLDYVPIKSEKIATTIKEDGLIDLIISRDGFLDTMVRKIARTPNRKVISLDSVGSGVWKAIDNNRDLGAIALVIKEEFGVDADPLYDRLLSFVRLLKNNEFIDLKRVES